MHASCVAVSGRGVLIMGPSGSGKSTLALSLMAYGADLVADDQSELHLHGDQLCARCPPALRGMIEARGVGILTAPAEDRAEITLAVDLSQPEPDRLPPQRRVTLLGRSVDLVLGQGNDHLAASVLCYLKGKRQA
ncbi:MAG: HPr kinase/phosphatase C-terminal domain-containing protein [bacterium]